ncbi:MAG: PQQ-binding-like beta-propeller repeat protein [Candidatus Bathyarchaeia archaeon]|jgi:outer membrane protein assembly factor BamB
MKTQKFQKSKSVRSIIAITLLLILATSTLMTCIPLSNAADRQNFAYITASPNPAGVGQTVTVVFFLTIPPPTGTAGFNQATNWDNYTVTITTPSDKVQNYGPYTSDATGGAYLTFQPDEVGTYKLDFEFPGQTIDGVNLIGFPTGSYTYGPLSATTNLTVQQEPTADYQTPPLPTDYWSRPIYAENRGWNTIGGNWLMDSYNSTGAFNPYTTAPNTAHIIWTRQQYMGGVVGGDYGDLNYYLAPTYQMYWQPPLIIDGKLYYMERVNPGDNWAGMHCVDIRTGKQQWFQDVSVTGGNGAGGGSSTTPIIGQIFSGDCANGHGAFAYIWNLGGGSYGTPANVNWTVLDANSGNIVYTINNPLETRTPIAGFPGVSGPQVLNSIDEYGSVIAYYIDGQNHWLLKWNSTLALVNAVGINNIVNARPTAFDWDLGIQWNITIPDHGDAPDFNMGTPNCDGNVVFAVTADILSEVNNFTLYAYSANDGHELWHSSFSDMFVAGSTLYEFFGPVADNVLTVYDKNSDRRWGFDATTGAKLWGPTSGSGSAWGTFESSTAAYGNLYVGAMDGTVQCYNIKTGILEWNYALPSSGDNTPYGTYPVYGENNGVYSSKGSAISIADGKVYAITDDHTPDSPYWLGGAMYCINASTGDLIYKMSGWWSSYPALADGYALDLNCYDGQIYSFGKGQTTVTVLLLIPLLLQDKTS